MANIVSLTEKLGGLDPASALVFAVLAIAIAGFATLSRSWFSWHEKSFSITRRRQTPLLDLLRKGQLAHAPALQLELDFRRCTGFDLPSDELRFALTRENSRRLLRALRHGRHMVRRSGDVYVRKTTTSLTALELGATLGATFSGTLCLGFVLYGWFAHSPGWYLVAVESSVLVWMCVAGSLAAGAARFLSLPENYPASPPLPVVTPKPRRSGTDKPRKGGKSGAAKPRETPGAARDGAGLKLVPEGEHANQPASAEPIHPRKTPSS